MKPLRASSGLTECPVQGRTGFHRSGGVVEHSGMDQPILWNQLGRPGFLTLFLVFYA